MTRDSYTYREKPGSTADAPMLFLFHGTGGDENQFFELGGRLLPQARLIAVRGDVSEHGALRYFRRTGEGVYDMDDLEKRRQALAKFVAAHIDGNRPRAVLGLGYSNGANILASTMFGHPNLFDGAVLMHPLIPFAPADAPALQGKKVLITAGQNDPICPAPQTQVLADYFTRQSSEVSLQWHDGGHELRQEELLAINQFLGAYRS